MALEDCVMWIHIKELLLLAGVFSLWMVSLVLLQSEMTGWKVSFFAGYGADSIIDVFSSVFPALPHENTPPRTVM
ncbi:MAG: hypothetical protein HXS43_02905 [Theionarchaea archaeon]|nr:hypothetical protein [Theionarchaea archaeon]